VASPGVPAAAAQADRASQSVPPRTVAEPSNLLTIIGTITSQAALITGVLYYIGWARTNSLFGYFGVDTALAGFSAPDYVLRGGSDVVHGLWIYVAFAATLCLVTIHRRIMIPALMSAQLGSLPSLSTAMSDLYKSNSSRGGQSMPARMIRSVIRLVRALRRWRFVARYVRWFIRLLHALAIMCAAAVLAGLLFQDLGASLGLALPLLLIFSVVLLGYVAHVHATYPDVFRKDLAVPRSSQSSRVYPLTLLALGLIASIWAMTVYGDRLGTKYATDIATRLPIAPEVVVYSADRIALNGPGIAVAPIVQPDTKYHYQYTGLRFLAHPSENYLLLPSEWRKGRDRVFLLRDDGSIRLDIASE
jgi:hypothetical protein